MGKFSGNDGKDFKPHELFLSLKFVIITRKIRLFNNNSQIGFSIYKSGDHIENQSGGNMKRGSIFELNGIPKFQEALPLALQHVVAMIVGCVTPAIIVAGAVGGDGLSAKDRVILIQASLVVSALSTLIQLFPIGKKKGFNLGSGLPMIMGVSFAYVPSMQAIAEGYGISTILGAQIVGGIVAIIMGLLVKKIRAFFPPLITGTVVFTIGLSLYPTAINYMAGGTSNSDYGSWQNWLVAFLTLAVVTGLNHFQFRLGWSVCQVWDRQKCFSFRSSCILEFILRFLPVWQSGCCLQSTLFRQSEIILRQRSVLWIVNRKTENYRMVSLHME